MIFGKNENGKKSQKLNNSKLYNEMILSGKGLPPLKEESSIKLIRRK